ncbi:MAG: hypothetical protein HY726_23470 [Candidatus Rokubacteria bacterium]|nr:hypothetical protein [Candidatus Rokubacteria bacterium]
MVFPDEIRKCVVFLGCRFSDGIKPVGTGFFLGTPLAEFPERSLWDLVTAKHVIQGIRKRSVDQKVYIRLNLKAGGTAVIESLITQWDFHPTPSVDVAVVPCTPPEEFDVKAYDIRASAIPDVIARNAIGIGDEVFFPGLFINYFGAERNIPIARIGNIAAMPEEPVQTQMGPMEAYLVEARSIGGLSGSPVFVHLGLARAFGGEVLFAKNVAGSGGIFYLLGLMHGHYDVTLPVQSEADADALRNEAINMGIAIVVPVTKIIETVNQPERVAKRKAREEEFKRANLPKIDELTNPSDE